MRRKNIQPSLNDLNDLFAARSNSKKRSSRKKSRFERAEIRRLELSEVKVETARRVPRNSSPEPREVCHEWMLWLLQCGLIERSHWPVSHSGLYTDFT